MPSAALKDVLGGPLGCQGALEGRRKFFPLARYFLASELAVADEHNGGCGGLAIESRVRDVNRFGIGRGVCE